uniref:Copper transport protein n=1 Tax=Parastrongyloides trichosuri TaxID=131310 RepID=A0A0N5A1L9_PARTI
MNGSGMNMNHEMHMKNKMWMWFHTTIDDTVLFSNLIIKNVKGMIICCVIFFILSIIQESLKYIRWRYELSVKYSDDSSYFKKIFSIPSLIRTVLFSIQITLSYIIMLVVMTFSIWLGLSIILGTGIGYFIFGNRIHEDKNVINRNNTNNDCHSS